MTAAEVCVGLSKEEAAELYAYLERQYISHSQYPLLHRVLHRVYAALRMSA